MRKKEKSDSRADAAAKREKTIVRTGIAGVAANLILAAGKGAVGLAVGSLAFTLDALNNLTDVLSAVVTIIGARIAVRNPDKEHPYGHGRAEYISAMIVSVIILYAGMGAARESVKGIISPAGADYTYYALIVIAIAVVVKIFLGILFKKRGKQTFSSALSASGTDALFDAAISASVLLSAVIRIVWGISLEAWVGLLISAFILRTGIGILRDSYNDILGRRGDPALIAAVRGILESEEPVRGAYDLIVTNFGPGRNYASVHLELPDTMKVEEVDQLERRLQTKVYRETGVILTGIGVYSFNTKDDEAAVIRNCVFDAVKRHDWALQIHGFHADTEAKTMRFDVVMSFDIPHQEGVSIISSEIGELYPGYSIQITPDIDAGEEYS